MKVLLSILIWLVALVVTIILFLVDFFLLLILFPFDKQRRIIHAQCFWWANVLIGLNPYWNVKVNGLEHIDHQRTYVVVSNHQSLADIVVMYKLRMQFKWVSKESLFKVPFIGWCLSMGKHIKLSRGKMESIKKIYRQASEWISNGMSVLFFPEGTRSNTDKMNKFQNGAFKLAIKEKVAVLPVCVKGTRDAIPKGSWIFRTGVFMELTVLPAIEVENYNPGDFIKLRDTTRSHLEKAFSC